jgi:hypothetical protein
VAAPTFPFVILIGSSGSFVITPNVGLMIWTLLVSIGLACGFVTAAKGRWGWALAGFLTAGLLWVPGALQAPLPGSVWSRIGAARHGRS